MGDDHVVIGWDMENCGVNKPVEFLTYLKGEIAKAFPGKQIEIHAVGVKDLKGTKKMIDHCTKDKSITCHLLENEGTGKDKEGTGKDRSDYKLICEIFLFAMRNRHSPLIVLLAGDDDFTLLMSTLDDLGYVLVADSSNDMGSNLRDKTIQLHIDWTPYKKEKKNGSTSTTSLPLPESESPKIQVPKTQVSKVLETLSTKIRTRQAPKQGDAVGVFVDADLKQFQKEKINALFKYFEYLAMGLKKNLETVQFYGNATNLPKEKEKAKLPQESDCKVTYTRTNNSKHMHQVHHFIAGMGKYAIEYGDTSTMVVMSNNPKLEIAIKCFSEAGFEVILHVSIQKRAEITSFQEHSDVKC